MKNQEWYIKLEIKQNTERDENIHKNSCSLELMDRKYIPDPRPICFNMHLLIDVKCASEKCIKEAIFFANSGKELLTEYQMLLSAYEARRQNENRRAILDACAAMEITIVKQIENFCDSKGFPSEIIIKKYLYLGDRIKLLRELYKDVPNENYKELVVEPRNALMHNKDVYPSDETTDNLFSCVEILLKHFYIAYY